MFERLLLTHMTDFNDKHRNKNKENFVFQTDDRQPMKSYNRLKHFRLLQFNAKELMLFFKILQKSLNAILHINFFTASRKIIVLIFCQLQTEKKLNATFMDLKNGIELGFLGIELKNRESRCATGKCFRTTHMFYM